jgi:histidinol-phosphate/aromatic aminotransferase/cobyric acid decarboxylase-like protein
VRFIPRPAATHGGATAAAIDLSASLNPLGPHPAALEAARRSELGRYPQPDAGQFVGAAARRHGLVSDCIVPTPGASWGLWLCAVALLGPGDLCLAIGPCFGEYRRSAEIAGAEFEEVTAWPPDRMSISRGLEVALERQPAMLVIANPSNPGGQATPGSDIRRLCEQNRQTIFLVDEAFASFAPGGTSLLESGTPPSNALVVRSLTKELGMPGLRMGYIVGDADLSGQLIGVLPAWPLSAPAIAAAVAGLDDQSHVEAGAILGRRNVAELATALAARGAVPNRSDANYLVAHAPAAAGELLDSGIAVRDCTSFGLPGHVRLAAPKPGEMKTVLNAIAGLGAVTGSLTPDMNTAGPDPTGRDQ